VVTLIMVCVGVGHRPRTIKWNEQKRKGLRPAGVVNFKCSSLRFIRTFSNWAHREELRADLPCSGSDRKLAIKRRRATPVAESVECRRARPGAAKGTQLGSLTVPSVGDSNDLHRTTGSSLVR